MGTPSTTDTTEENDELGPNPLEEEPEVLEQGELPFDDVGDGETTVDDL